MNHKLLIAVAALSVLFSIPAHTAVDPGAMPEGVTPEIWSKLAPQLNAAMYQFKADSDGSFYASNPEQGFEITADAAGVKVCSGIALHALQFGTSATDMEALPTAPPQMQGARLEYQRGRVLEWFENRPDGLEQGFTIAAPAGGAVDHTDLRLLVDLSGARAVAVDAIGQNAIVTDEQGRDFGYSGLKAWDAIGRALECRMQAAAPIAGSQIMLVCNTRDAIWPITIDPVLAAMDKKLTVDDGAANDEFGYSVAVDGDVAVVGAFQQADHQGAAYIFERNAGGVNNWGHVRKLTASDGAAKEWFGCSVSVAGDVVLVGSYRKNTYSGAAYVFERNAGGVNNWGQVKKLTAPFPTAYHYFGHYVSVAGDIAVVGAYGTGDRKGAAYIFERNAEGPSQWGYITELTAPGLVAEDAFGCSVSVAGDVVVVGAHGTDSAKGAVYVFERNSGGANSWSHTAVLTADDGVAGDRFGDDVAVDGDVVVVGAYGIGGGTGAAYIFERNADGVNQWGQVAKRTASDLLSGEMFGVSVSVAGDVVVVGAYGKDSYTGAAYIFERNADGINNWGQAKKLTASDGAAMDLFGGSVAIAGDVVLIGAFEKDSRKGAAYVMPVSLQAKNFIETRQVIADNAINDAYFGYSVAVDGDVAVVGAPLVNSSQGVTYVFERNAAGINDWGKVAVLTASDGEPSDNFGKSVALAGDVLVVGASMKNSFIGAAYVFRRNAGGANTWGQVAKLTASDPATYAYFGDSVAVDGDVAVVGAYGTSSSTGAAYVFERNEGDIDDWGEVKKLTAPGLVASDAFGCSVSVAGDVVVVGARGTDGAKGAAYIFERNKDGANNWGEAAILTAPELAVNDWFGWSVAVAGDVAVVGAYGTDAAKGAAYIFERNHDGGINNWGKSAVLTASDGDPNDYFGRSVAISGDTIIASAYRHGSCKGAAYVFQRNAGGLNDWGEIAKLSASDTAENDFFGSSVSIADDVAVVGAYGKDSYKGAAYIFENRRLVLGEMAISGTNGADIANGAAAVPENGTDFGTLVWGSSLTNTFTITNPGNADLTISDWTTSGADAGAFVIAGIPTTLAPEGEASFTVTFTPSAVGIFTAALHIANDSLDSLFVLNLAGTGIKQDQAALVFDPASPQTYNTINTLSATGGSGIGAVTYAVLSGPGEIIGDDGLKALSGLGTITVVATKAADAYYNAVSATAQVVCVQADQAALVFEPVSPQAYNTINALSVTGGSGIGAVTYAVLSGPGEIIGDDGLKALSGLGTITVVATKAADADYNAVSATAQVACVQADQAALVFEPVSPQIYNTINVLSVTGGSGVGAVTYAVLSGPGEIIGDDSLKALSGLGTITVVATKAADADYNAVSATAQVVCVKADQSIVFPAIPDQPVTGTVVLTATASSGLPVTFAVASGPGVINNATLTFSDAGIVTVVASQDGNEDWVAAAPVTNNVVVLSTGAVYVPGDFDGDGKSDLTIYYTDPFLTLWYSVSADSRMLAWEQAWGGDPDSRMMLPVIGDYDGDGIADLCMYDAYSGLWFIRTLTDTVLAWGEPWGGPGYMPVAGDYDGDGLWDLCVYCEATGLWYARSLAGETLFYGLEFGGPGFAPVAGDYDGDRAHDLVVCLQDTHTDPNWIYWYGLSTSEIMFWAMPWGVAGWVPVPGDYDGDGAYDLCVYDTANGLWYVASADGLRVICWAESLGGPGCTPVSGDFHGDGLWDLCVYDAANGLWYARTVSGNVLFWDVSFGGPGYLPASE